ncbi:MAG TPA: hypothetical protein VHE82_03050 [Gemmatimonadaceae bacterium]|nr:hypothetical protein [Gemmatimonadaceae bacterium]
MRPNLKAFLPVLGVLLLSACGGDSTGVSGDATGTYTINSINGNSIPYSVTLDPTYTITFTGGNFMISSGGAFSETISYTELISGTTTNTTSTCPGTYTQNGGSFTFTEAPSPDPNCGATYTGTWNGSDTFTMAFDVGFQAVYKK